VTEILVNKESSIVELVKKTATVEVQKATPAEILVTK